ncbi:MAG: glutamate--cysteine ligase, partial [Candidatus Melainabacteria bacterium HGW-Melainabacteria-1]
NLPFRDDGEFALLHSAVRVVLPLIPALAASSPVMEGRITGMKDTRLEAYRTNQDLVPSIVGGVIPEAVYSRREYEERILEPMYRDIAPLDPEGILSDEWLNSRGAIACFDRNTIEIRLIDTQECASMDTAVAAAVYYLVRGLVEGFFTAPLALRRVSTELLRGILDRAVRDGGDAFIGERDYLGLFGLDSKPRKASFIWRLLAGSLAERYPEMRAYIPRLDIIAEEGTLSDRILRGLGGGVTRDSIIREYSRLASCLDGDLPYRP